MFNIKEKSSKQYSRNRNYLLFELSYCTNFDINLFVKDFEKLINLINKYYCYVSSNYFCNYCETFQYLPIPSNSKPSVAPSNSGQKRGKWNNLL